MLWTLGRLWLFLGLGVTTGACLTLFATSPEGKSWRQWMLIPGLAAAYGAVCLIIEWMGPVGGGG